MGTGKRMHESVLSKLLAFSFMISLTDGSPMKVMSAPNLLRIGAAENIFVECQDCSDGNNFTVEISAWNLPTKSKRLASTSVVLTSQKKFQDFAQITIPPGFFSGDPDKRQYVLLQAQFPDVKLEKAVLVSFQSGYIFIQTDKTLYTPNSIVHFRVFGVTHGMEPVERDNMTRADTSIVIEFVTPEGLVLPRNPVSLISGIYSGDFQLAEIVSFGLWKVVVRFYSRRQMSFSAEFEVKDYVLPSFEVKLTPQTPFFYVDSEDLTVNIKATYVSELTQKPKSFFDKVVDLAVNTRGFRRVDLHSYLFGEQVAGSAFGVFGVMHNGQKRSFPSSLQRVSVHNGEGTIVLKRHHISETFENVDDLVGSSIFAAVSVLTESGNEMSEGELKGIQIVTSPYTVLFKKTPKYFKPGLSFDVVIEVVNPDGSPADGIPIVIADDVQGNTEANGMARLSINTEENPQPMEITVKTNDPRISPERQASATMTAHPYFSQNNNYIHIGVDTAEVKLGDNLKVNLNFRREGDEQNEITYLILSRGQLVKFGRYKLRSQVLVSLMIPITKDMLPSFRIVAYYHPNDKEVVSDSVWVDVKDSCMGSLKLESVQTAAYYGPGNKFQLKIIGDPDATVGLVAVDKGVYMLNNKHRLSQTKVWDTVEMNDIGCTPGGGKDSMSVFFDAGLLFQSNFDSGTPYRQVSLYDNELQRDCCLDGLRETPVSYNCETRSEYITDGTACVEAFLHCCEEIENLRAVQKQEVLQLARSEEDDSSFMDTNNIISRTKFPESWYWTQVKLPPCTRSTCDTTSLVREFPLQDTITTWQFTGISLSMTNGICVADPLEVIVRKPFFIDLRLPHSAVRGEQLEIRAILNNHNPNPINVIVDLMEETSVCSVASRRGKFRQEILVGPETTHSVPFIIIPTREGHHRIEVKAFVNSVLTDGVMKILRVVPEGLLIKARQIVTLDPTNKGEDGIQVETINSQIPRVDLVPNTPTSTHIDLTGRQNANIIKNTISGESMGHLIYQPSGCGEENMIHLTQLVIATTYLDKTNEWEPVGIDRRNEALLHIETGYQNQLAYRKKDGSFAQYADQQSSTWLTAFVVKVLSLANNLVAVQSKVICDAIRFLLINAQQPDGLFRETGRVSISEMIGDVNGEDSDVSLTAFCLVAMQESRTLCASSATLMSNLAISIDRAVMYLETRLSSVINPYAIAMASYALANENKLNRESLSFFSSPDSSHWPVPAGRVYTLEATAYALLALIKAKAFEEARPVVRWLNKQRRQNGSFGSTQANLIVYQALGEYWTTDRGEDSFLDVDILLGSRSKPDKYSFSWENPFSTRTSKINSINQDVKVRAAGPGEATLTIMSLYYALPKEKDTNCQKFNLSVQLIPEKLDKEEKIFKLKIEVLYKHQEHDATMSVLDIGLLTGFTVNTKDLDLLSKGRARTIARYRVNTVAVDRGSVLIYLGKVSHTRPEEITFRVHQKMKVGILQPAAVSIYEFNHYEYSVETHCVKFYHPERRAGELLQLCTNDECTCAEEDCSMQKRGKINNEERKAKICETTPTSRIDFVYQVRLEEFTDGLSIDMYKMQVLQAIKEGSYDVNPEGKERLFMSHQHCRVALDLQPGKTYLIMGTARDLYKDKKNQLYQYVIGERTWIEYWPTKAECETGKYNSTCTGIKEMTDEYYLNGCQSK